MMSRFLAPALAAVLIAACSENKLSNPAAPDRRIAPANEVIGSVTGSGHWEVFAPPVPPGLGLRNLALNAVKRVNGRVTGEWQIVVGSTILHGPLDCVEFLPDGKSARISGLVEDVKFSLAFEPNTAFGMLIVDNGQGANDPRDEDSDLLSFLNAPPETGRDFCENGTLPAGFAVRSTLIGNFQVRSGE